MKLARRNIIATAALLAGSVSFIFGVDKGLERLGYELSPGVPSYDESKANHLSQESLIYFGGFIGCVALASQQRIKQVQAERDLWNIETASMLRRHSHDLTDEIAGLAIKEDAYHMAFESIKATSILDVPLPVMPEPSGEHLATITPLRPEFGQLNPDNDSSPRSPGESRSA